MPQINPTKPNKPNTPSYGHETPYLYRLEDKNYSVVVDAEREEYSSRTVINVWKFPVTKTTPTGWWINGEGNLLGRRFVKKDARKVYAAPSYALALESYLKRKERQAAIYYGRAKHAEYCAHIAKKGRYEESAGMLTELRDTLCWDFQPSHQLIKKD